MCSISARSLAADAVEHLQQHGAQQALGGDRGAAGLRIQIAEAAAHAPQHRAHQRVDAPQRMIAGHPLLQRSIAEHLPLLLVVSSHTRSVCQVRLSITRFFQRPFSATSEACDKL
jgi:alkylation response protein AidB-like acyl-CoA dehydrogenase